VDLSSAPKKYRTPSAAAEPLSAPGPIQKVRMPSRIGAGPVIPRADKIATEAVAYTDHAGGRQELGRRQIATGDVS
jgi:hypothetical protein